MIDHIETSDQHINSRLGLCAPVVKYDGGGKYEHSERQSIIWKYWLDFCSRITRSNNEKVFVLDGDIFDFDPISQQRISSNPADILKIGLATLEPLLSINGYKFIVRGTEHHTGSSGWLEEMFAEHIGAEKCPETGDHSWWHLRQNIEGVNFDISHHITIGSMPHTKLNKAFSTIYEVRDTCIDAGYPVPDIIFRAHVHTFIDTEHANKKTRLIITPSWQAKTAYGFKRATNKINEHGGTITRINNGKFEIENIIYTPRREPIWTL